MKLQKDYPTTPTSNQQGCAMPGVAALDVMNDALKRGDVGLDRTKEFNAEEVVEGKKPLTFTLPEPDPAQHTEPLSYNCSPTHPCSWVCK